MYSSFIPGKKTFYLLLMALMHSLNCSLWNFVHAHQNENIKYEIGTWLRLYGVPLHEWTIQFLSLCPSMFGRLLKVDLCTKKLKRMDFAGILISIASLESINIVEVFLINEKSCFIKLVKELERGLPIDMFF